MHEMAIMNSVRDLVEDEAREKHFSVVKSITLVVGPFSCVDPHALRFSFDAVSRASILEGSKLVVEQPAGKAQCFDCEAIVDVLSRDQDCPLCSSSRLLMVEGDELAIKNLEVL
ncbi:MAG: hydrogenase maturation nickel metallochaperone HypA [Pseudomonadota bacterium]